jgi:hypothetical protein
VHTQITRDENYHDDNADDVEDHWVLLQLCASITKGGCAYLWSTTDAFQFLTISRTVSFMLPTAF